jgi:phage-related protein
MAITTAVSDLFSSFYELIASIFGAAYSLVHGLVSVIVGFFSGVVNLILGFIRETLHAAGSSGKFVLRKLTLLTPCKDLSLT